jgi:protein-S-isoprenylcysteine O-methyltransferase Ste14
MKWIDIPPVWLLGTLILAWVTGRGAAFAGLGLVGGVLVLAGLALMVAAVLQMMAARTTPIPHMQPQALVSTGIFGLSRNPIYLGDVLVLAGCCLRWGAWSGLVLVPLLVWVLTVRFIRPEEARLRAAFGPAFDAYAARTGRWIGRWI